VRGRQSAVLPACRHCLTAQVIAEYLLGRIRQAIAIRKNAAPAGADVRLDRRMLYQSRSHGRTRAAWRVSPASRPSRQARRLTMSRVAALLVNASPRKRPKAWNACSPAQRGLPSDDPVLTSAKPWRAKRALGSWAVGVVLRRWPGRAGPAPYRSSASCQRCAAS
jgi:hypothetical protein